MVVGHNDIHAPAFGRSHFLPRANATVYRYQQTTAVVINTAQSRCIDTIAFLHTIRHIILYIGI